VTCVVVKLGGHALDSLEPRSARLVELALDVAQLRAAGTDVAIVHGGGPQISALLDGLGLESHFHEGLRVTDTTTMAGVAMALAYVNLRITAALNAAGLDSVGLSGADTTLLCASSLGEPWLRVGSAPKVRTDIITTLWQSGVTPVISPIAVDENGEPLNCNADAVAGALAGALGAEALVLLSDVDQLRTDVADESSGLSSVVRAQITELLATGHARDGMRPKMVAALDALDGGAGRILLANGTRPHALRDALAGRIPTTEVMA
jgi:acetylglutamate kinase